MRDHQQHHTVGGRHNIVMGKLKESLLFRLAALNPSISINSTHASFVEQRLQQLFNSFHTPTHPPYALMIKRAIMELDEETESTEEAISEFIRKKYEELPWAHARILHVHLRKLCLDGELVCTMNGRYYTKCIQDGEPYKTNVQPDLIIRKHIQDGEQQQVLKNPYHSAKQQNGVYDELSELCDQQPEVIHGQNYEALIEHQTQIQQIGVTNEMLGYSSDEKTVRFMRVCF